MSKVVFVGNVPYNMGEDQLIDVFKSVGQVIGFRLVFDRDTGKPRGYGFCEFADHETAASAVRNLNNTDVGGRLLRIDLADSDPFLEGKTTVRGELIDGGTPGPAEPRSGWRASGSENPQANSLLANLPPGIQVPPGAQVLDYISQTLATMQPSQLMEVLAQMKAFVITHPEQARTLLVGHPQLAYALFQALLLNNIVDNAILQRMLAATSGAQTMAPPPARPPVPPPRPQQQQPQYPPMPHQGYPPQPVPQPMPSLAPPPTMSAPPAAAMFGHHQLPPQMPPPSHQPHPGMPPPMASYGYRPPPPAQPMAPPAPQVQVPPPAVQPAAPAPPAISDDQHAMIMQVFSLTQEQINAFPEAQRQAIQQLRTQYSQMMSGVGA